MHAHRDSSGAITQPPLIYAAFLALGLGLDWRWPVPLMAQPAQYASGLLLFVPGLVLVLWAARQFMHAGTSLQVNHPSTTLVVAGPYQYSRNPIYLGLTLAYLGVAAAIDSMWLFLMIAAILPALHYGVIIREETYLERIFGEVYRRYRTEVRRWL